MDRLKRCGAALLHLLVVHVVLLLLTAWKSIHVEEAVGRGEHEGGNVVSDKDWDQVPDDVLSSGDR